MESPLLFPNGSSQPSPQRLRTGRRSRCRVCCHADRARVELLRAGGAGLLALAREFGLKKDSLSRHFKNHVSAKRLAEMVAGPLKVEQLAAAAADAAR